MHKTTQGFTKIQGEQEITSSILALAQTYMVLKVPANSIFYMYGNISPKLCLF